MCIFENCFFLKLITVCDFDEARIVFSVLTKIHLSSVTLKDSEFFPVSVRTFFPAHCLIGHRAVLLSWCLTHDVRHAESAVAEQMLMLSGLPVGSNQSHLALGLDILALIGKRLTLLGICCLSS